MFENGFPNELCHDVQTVLAALSSKTSRNTAIGQSESYCSWTLLSGEQVSFPKRIYDQDQYDAVKSSLSPVQKIIYSCIFSRSDNGFVREKHIKNILSSQYTLPEWSIPYIVKVSDEYVVEILDTVYYGLKVDDLEQIKRFCKKNISEFLKSHDRMISYWNEYYRKRFPEYKRYVGNKLFSECFGYTRAMEKMRNHC